MTTSTKPRRGKDGKFAGSFAGAGAVPTAQPVSIDVDQPLQRARANDDGSAITRTYERFRAQHDVALSPEQRAIVAILDADDGETYSASSDGRSVTLFDGEVDIHSQDGSYVVTMQTMVRSGSLWNPPEYQEVEVATVSRAAEAVEVARNVHEYGDEYFSEADGYV